MNPLRLALLLVPLLGLAAPQVAADRFAVLDTRIQQLVADGEVAGAVVLVANRDTILHLAVAGKSDLASGRAMHPDDLFGIASMTKPITAVAAAILVDEGRLAFDDPVEKHLPEFRDPWVIAEQTKDPRRRVLVPSPRTITVRDLLTHTSGLGPLEIRDAHWTLSEAVKVVSREPLRFPPGSRWEYCDSGYFVLGRLVEVVAGEPFPSFLQRRIFGPLGMRDTCFWISPENRSRLAQAYCQNPGTRKPEGWQPPAAFGDPADPARIPRPSGGLFSTAADIAAFYQMLLGGGTRDGMRILRPETAAELTRCQTGDLEVWPGVRWGLGFALIEDPTGLAANRTYSPGSYGHGGIMGTSSYVDSNRGVVRIIMVHVAGLPPNPANSLLRQACEQAIAEALGLPPTQ